MRNGVADGWWGGWRGRRDKVGGEEQSRKYRLSVAKYLMTNIWEKPICCLIFLRSDPFPAQLQVDSDLSIKCSYSPCIVVGHLAAWKAVCTMYLVRITSQLPLCLLASSLAEPPSLLTSPCPIAELRLRRPATVRPQ
jgi:hypothetical protein